MKPKFIKHMMIKQMTIKRLFPAAGIKFSKVSGAMSKLNMKFLAACCAALLIVLGATGAEAQSSENLTKVKVYFWESNRAEEGDDLIAFTREVEARAPLRPAIEALLAGPTAEEEAKGFEGVAYGDMKLASIKIKGGTARIDFQRTIRGADDFNPGDLLTLRFQEAVIRTAEQFPTIKKAIVCVNGKNEFGLGMVIDSPVPCEKLK